MRYAVVCIGNLDVDCGSWLAGVTSDRSLARQLADNANLLHTHLRKYSVFQIPEEDFIDERLKDHAESGEKAARQREDAATAYRIEQAEAAAQKKARKVTYS